ncbi:MAG: HD domain-containing protein [Rhodobacteraceae bacterium]|nr:HD domain-containing protein [Paracoccaceae bacterium]
MAHLVYPGAGHDRLEHTRGVVEAAERMIRALERNAEFRRRFGSDRDEAVPHVSPMDRCATRLAALLHDTGHGPFSHATEQLIRTRYAAEFNAVEHVLRKHFEGVTSIAPAESVAVLIVLSDSMREVLTHARLGTGVDNPTELPEAVAARILGSRSCLRAGYLSGIISGPVDADKLDYIARDCHHSGLPLGIDLTRLISKLEVVVVTPENAPNRDLRVRAQNIPGRRFYDIGISLTGLGSYEQLIIARVLLYDRLYYHQKVRTAEAMLRRLICLAEEERGTLFTIEEFYTRFPDDIFVGVIGGSLQNLALKRGGVRSQAVARMIQDRRIYYRAHAFAARFIGGLEGLSDVDQRDTRAEKWRKLLRELLTDDDRKKIETKIFDKAKALAGAIPDLADRANGLNPEEILVDVPSNRVVVRGGDILTRTDGGHIGTPNLFFDPERWSQAYEHQKQCGFVFTPRNRVPLVALASRIVLYESFKVVMDIQAERAAKVTNVVKSAWVAAAQKHGLCSEDCEKALNGNISPPLIKFHPDDIALPREWSNLDPDLRQRLVRDLNLYLPSGLVAASHKAVSTAIGDVAVLIDMFEKTGMFVSEEMLAESRLQDEIKQHFMSCQIDVVEGSEISGGETDLILSRQLVVENKVVSNPIRDPFETGYRFSWQARRYSISLCSNVAIVILAYRPSSEENLLQLPARVRILEIREDSEERCEVRFVVPWGTGVPSRAKSPAKKAT